MCKDAAQSKSSRVWPASKDGDSIASQDICSRHFILAIPLHSQALCSNFLCFTFIWLSLIPEQNLRMPWIEEESSKTSHQQPFPNAEQNPGPWPLLSHPHRFFNSPTILVALCWAQSSTSMSFL